MNERILFVDDNPNLLAAIKRQLHGQFEVDTCTDAYSALEKIKKGKDYAVVVADMQMPKMNGIQFLERVRLVSPYIVRIMLTGNIDQETAVSAINQAQVYRYINKPCPTDVMALYLVDAIKHFQTHSKPALRPLKKRKEVNLESIRIGDTLCSNLVTSENLLIVSAGTEITRTLQRRLCDLKEAYVFKSPIVIER